MQSLLGAKGTRQPMIDYCSAKFRTVYGQNWKMTKAQMDSLQIIDKSFVCFDCVAGSGKTTILLCLALWMLHVREIQNHPGCMHYMTENQALADDFLERLIALQGNNIGIFPLGSASTG